MFFQFEFLSTSLSLVGNSGCLTCPSATRAALPIPISACSICMCSSNGVPASVVDF